MTTAAQSAAWRAANPDRMRQHQARYRAAHREELRASYRDYYAANKKLFQERHRIRAYGLTPETFRSLLEAQRGLCALCSEPLSKDHTFVAVDHDHATGAIRGLLHRGCNVAVGAFENNRENLQRYLKLHGEN